MKIRRFKVPLENFHGGEAFIRDRDEIRRIYKVLRLRVGDAVFLFDGQGRESLATIAALSPAQISFILGEGSPSFVTESPLKIILGLGRLKSSGFDWLLQKATELGVSEILPFYSLRTVPKRRENETSAKGSRWEKILYEAARQCGRAKIPLLHPPILFSELLALEFQGTTKIFLWEKERNGKLKNLLPAPPPAICVLVGPEGGFSDAEAGQAKEAGFQSVRLGPRILRAETAGMMIVGLLQFLWGDLK